MFRIGCFSIKSEDDQVIAAFSKVVKAAIVVLFLLVVFTPGLALAENADYDTVTSDSQYEDTVTAANMVLLVSFSDTSQETLDSFNAQYATENPLGIKTNWQYFMWSINGIKQTFIQRTFRDYLYDISQSQCNVKSYFPQTQEDGTIAHITLDNPASYYSTNDGVLLSEIADKFNKQFGSYDASRVDKNNDGYLDNLMIVPVTSGVFTSHKISLGGALQFGSGNQARSALDSITVVEGSGYSVFAGSNSSVAAHEYLHTLGARDYYRDGISGDPVSYWDLMAKGSVFSWPLAFTREQVGWASIPEVDLNNLEESYTLYAPADSDAKKGVTNPSKPQALKIKTSLSSSEYFIVEYRKQNTSSMWGYDRYIGASGLIVYRVNEAYSVAGNYRGDDYVYVFRPGETGLKDSAGDINSAAITASAYASQNGRTLAQSIGSTDLNATFSDNTIFYANGTNSGIKIDAVSQTDGSITIKISSANYDQSDAWQAPSNSSGGSDPFGSWSTPSVNITSDEANPYLLIGNQSLTAPQWAVWKYDGSKWAQCGTKLSDLQYAHIVYYDGKPYLYGVSQSNKKEVVLKTLDSGQWKTVTSAALSQQVWSTDARVIGGVLYVFAGATDDCQIMSFDGSAFAQYGPKLPFSQTYNMALSDSGGKPMLVANDQDANKTNMYKLEGSSWKTIQLRSSSSSAIESVSKDGKTYVYSFSANGDDAHRAQLSIVSGSGSIEATLNLDTLQDATLGSSLCAGKDNLYFIKNSGDQSVRAYSISFSALAAGDGGQLVQLGGPVFTNASEMDSVAVGDAVFCALGDTSSNSVAVRYHKLQSGDTAEPLDPSDPNEGEKDPEPTTISISEASVSVSDQTYTGSALTPKPTVKYDSKTLVEGTDYTLSYSNNTNVGTARIVITGKGNYTGTKTVTFKINAAAGKPLSSATVSSSHMTKNATGKALSPLISVKYGSTTLRAGTDYSITYNGSTSAPTKAGNYTVKIVGKGSYSGEKTVGTFRLVQGPNTGSSQVRISSLSNSNYVLDAAGSTPKIGANISIWTDNGGNNQKWYLSLGSDGYYTIKSASNQSFIIDAANATPKQGSNASIWTSHGGNNQKWIIEPSTNGSYIIRNVANQNLVLDASGSSPKKGANVSVWTSHGGNNQKWKITTVTTPSFDSTKTYEITSLSNSNYTLDAAGSTPKKGANVSIWTKHGGKNQRWYLVPDGKGYYTIKSASNPSYVLDAAGSTPKKGSNVSIWTSHGGNNQKWKIEQLANGSYLIRSAANPNYVLDASGSSPKKGANVSIWASHGGSNQKWKITAM